MKTLASLAAFCLSLITASAQQFSVSAEKMNVVYIGVPNPLKICVEGYSCEELVVTASEGELRSTGRCEWDYTASVPGKARISIAVKKGGSLKTIGTSEFRIKNITDPVAKIAGKSGGTISYAVLNAQIGIMTVLENFDFDAHFAVTSFEVDIMTAAGPVTYKNSGPIFSDEIHAAFHNLKNNDKLVFHDIKASGPDSRSRILNEIQLTVIR